MSIQAQRYNECLRLADHAKALYNFRMYKYWMERAEEYRCIP